MLKNLFDKYKPMIFFAPDIPVVWISTYSEARKGGVIRLQVNLTDLPGKPEYTVNPNYIVKHLRKNYYFVTYMDVIIQISTLLQLLKIAEEFFTEEENKTYTTAEWAIVNMGKPTPPKKTVSRDDKYKVPILPKENEKNKMASTTSDLILEQLNELVKNAQELNQKFEKHEKRLLLLEARTGIFPEEEPAPSEFEKAPAMFTNPNPKGLYIEYSVRAREISGFMNVEKTLTDSGGFVITPRNDATKAVFVTAGDESLGRTFKLKDLYANFGGENVFVVELHDTELLPTSGKYPGKLTQHKTYYYNPAQKHFIYLEPTTDGSRAVKTTDTLPAPASVVITASDPKNLYVEYTNDARKISGVQDLEKILQDSGGFIITQYQKDATKVAFVTAGDESFKEKPINQLKILYESFDGPKNVFVIELQDDDEIGGTVKGLYPEGFREHTTYYYNIKQNHFIITEPTPSGGKSVQKKKTAAPLVKPAAQPPVFVAKNSASLYLYIPNNGADQIVRNAIEEITTNRLKFKIVKDKKDAHHLAVVGLENDFGFYKDNIINTVEGFDPQKVFLVYVTMTPGKQYKTQTEFKKYVSYTYNLDSDEFVDNEPTPDGPREVSKSAKMAQGGFGKQQQEGKKKVVINLESSPNSIAFYNANKNRRGIYVETNLRKKLEAALFEKSFEIVEESSSSTWYGVVFYKQDYASTASLKKELENQLSTRAHCGIVITSQEIQDLPLVIENSFVFQWVDSGFVIHQPLYNGANEGLISEFVSVPKFFGTKIYSMVPKRSDKQKLLNDVNLKKLCTNLGLKQVEYSEAASILVFFIADTKSVFDEKIASINSQVATNTKSGYRSYKVCVQPTVTEDPALQKKIFQEGCFIVPYKV